MKYILPDAKCRFRGVGGFCFWNCPHDVVDSDCKETSAGFGCPWICVYEALESKSFCPFKHELQKFIQKGGLV